MLPQPYTVTNAGERFLLYDNDREDRLLLFGTDRSIDHLARMGHLRLPHFSPHKCTVFMGFQKVGILHVLTLCFLISGLIRTPLCKTCHFHHGHFSVNITIFPWVLWVIVCHYGSLCIISWVIVGDCGSLWVIVHHFLGDCG